MIFENKLIQNNLEEISKLKFKDDNLDKFRDFLFNKIFIENISVDLKSLEYITNQHPFHNEIDLLYKTHLGGLDEKEKTTFFEQILNNLKLPDLQNEMERLKKLILQTTNNEKQSELISKYNGILEEIKIIKNKELE